MAVRALCLALLVGAAQCQQSGFCSKGIAEPEFYEDHGKPSVEVILAAAPVFPDKKAVSSAFGLSNLYKTALVFKQKRPFLGIDRYWTLEFDFTNGSMLTGTVPSIVGDQLVWDDDARYCLTDDLVGGTEHWTKDFDTVMTVTKEQASRVFSEFVRPMNSSAKGAFPHFQLWRMVKSPGIKLPKLLEGDNRKQHVLNLNTMLSDVTSSDGINWVLHFIKETLGVAPYKGFQYHGTTVWLNAHKLEKVDRSDAKTWKDVLSYYKMQRGIVGNATTLIDKYVIAVTNLFPMKYVHNANTDTYFKVQGNVAPFFHVEYAPQLLVAPPSAEELREKVNGDELEQRNAVQLKALEDAPDSTLEKVLGASVDFFGKAQKATAEALTGAGKKSAEHTKKLDHKRDEERARQKKKREEAKAKELELAAARKQALLDKKAALEEKRQKLLADFAARKANPEEYREKEQKAAPDEIQERKMKQIAAHKARLAASAEQVAKDEKKDEEREIAAAFKAAKEEKKDEEREIAAAFKAAKEPKQAKNAKTDRKAKKAKVAEEASEEKPEEEQLSEGAKHAPTSTQTLLQKSREKQAEEDEIAAAFKAVKEQAHR